MRIALVWLPLLISACTTCSASRPKETLSAGEPHVVRERVYSSRGSVIWAMAFLPDGSLLFTLRQGELRRLVLGEDRSTRVAGTTDAAFAGLFAQGQSGLMGVAVDPAFAENRRVYLYFSHEARGVKDNRVARFRLREDFALEDRADIVTGIPFKAAATKDGEAGLHSGGRLHFGPDGFLYLTTGDNHNPTIPQDPEALGGKVLRFTSDGAPAPGNPGIASKNLIWAMGFRNVQGIAFHPKTGATFISEHGPNQDDEVTKLSAGSNGGWNPIGPDGRYNGYDGARMTDTTAIPDATLPVWVHADSQGMSDCAFLHGPIWKAWNDRLAVGFLAGKEITVLALNDALSGVTETDDLPEVTERVRSLVVGPDDALYVSTDSGLILRYAPVAE